ncbi:hypothetical protein NHQ30_010465 [Ciborinia camelliae]|nr:hypothetical protein NHQ30_010465 [Ciborinia camelliae]
MTTTKNVICAILTPGESPNPLNTCYANETYHHFCGHIITVHTHHSALCNACQKPTELIPIGTETELDGSRLSISKISRLRKAGSPGNPAPAPIHEAELFDLRPPSTLSQTPSTLSRTPSASSRTPSTPSRIHQCPQVIPRPFYEPGLCPSCSQFMGMGPGNEKKAEREMTGKEKEQWGEKEKGFGCGDAGVGQEDEQLG